MIGNKLCHTPGRKGGGACGAISSFASWGVVQLVSYHRGLPRGPWGLPRGLIAGCLEVQSRVASRSHVQVASRYQGTNFETKIFNFMCFLALKTKTTFTTPHYYPKYEVLAIEIFLW